VLRLAALPRLDRLHLSLNPLPTLWYPGPGASPPGPAAPAAPAGPAGPAAGLAVAGAAAPAAAEAPAAAAGASEAGRAPAAEVAEAAAGAAAAAAAAGGAAGAGPGPGSERVAGGGGGGGPPWVPFGSLRGLFLHSCMLDAWGSVDHIGRCVGGSSWVFGVGRGPTYEAAAAGAGAAGPRPGQRACGRGRGRGRAAVGAVRFAARPVPPLVPAGRLGERGPHRQVRGWKHVC
jgi:hypothetical protein